MYVKSVKTFQVKIFCNPSAHFLDQSHSPQYLCISALKTLTFLHILMNYCYFVLTKPLGPIH